MREGEAPHPAAEAAARALGWSVALAAWVLTAALVLVVLWRA